MEKPKVPEICPYCGKKLEIWVNDMGKLSECKRCKVQWQIAIKPECLQLLERSIQPNVKEEE